MQLLALAVVGLLGLALAGTVMAAEPGGQVPPEGAALGDVFQGTDGLWYQVTASGVTPLPRGTAYVGRDGRRYEIGPYGPSPIATTSPNPAGNFSGVPAASGGGTGAGGGGSRGGGGNNYGDIGGAAAGIAAAFDGTVDTIDKLVNLVDKRNRGTGEAADHFDSLLTPVEMYHRALETLAAELVDMRDALKAARPKPDKATAQARTWLKDYLQNRVGYEPGRVGAILAAAGADRGDGPINKVRDYMTNAAAKVLQKRNQNKGRSESALDAGHTGKAEVLARYGGPARAAWINARDRWDEYTAARLTRHPQTTDAG